MSTVVRRAPTHPGEMFLEEFLKPMEFTKAIAYLPTR